MDDNEQHASRWIALLATLILLVGSSIALAPVTAQDGGGNQTQEQEQRPEAKGGEDQTTSDPEDEQDPRDPDSEKQMPQDVPEEYIPPGTAPPATEYSLEDGYKLELVKDNLTFPTSVAVSPNGRVFVTESGYSYGPATSAANVVEITDTGKAREVARLPDGPLTGITWHEGSLYVVGGRAPATVWEVHPDTGEQDTVVTGFPVYGHHFTSDIDVGPDGKLTFAVGYPSNTGVVGFPDMFIFGWLPMFPEGHGIPCDGLNLTLNGRDFERPNWLTPNTTDTAVTGPFEPFGDPAEEGERVDTNPPPNCNGAVFKVNPDGSDLEVVSQGHRNLYGLDYAPNGTLYAINQGTDFGPPRFPYRDWDSLWRIQEDQWYGFPDYLSGLPITDEHFDGPHHDGPKFVLKEHPEYDLTPTFRFQPNSGSHQMDFSTSERFGHKGDLFVGQYGAQMVKPIVGYKVMRYDFANDSVHEFYTNKEIGITGIAPERPSAVSFGGNGSTLYVVDFGEIETDGGVFYPSADTGALWQVTPEDMPNAGLADEQEPTEPLPGPREDDQPMGPEEEGNATANGGDDANGVPAPGAPATLLVAVLAGFAVRAWNRRSP